MKRLLALIAVAGLAVGLYAATATGGQQAVTPAQFAALKKQVTTMQKDVNALKGFVSNCISVVGVAQFGGGTAGYHYKQPDGSDEAQRKLADLYFDQQNMAGDRGTQDRGHCARCCEVGHSPAGSRQHVVQLVATNRLQKRVSALERANYLRCCFCL